MRRIRYNSADFFCVTVMVLIGVSIIAYGGCKLVAVQGQENRNQNNSNTTNQNSRNTNNSNTGNQNSRNSNNSNTANQNNGNSNMNNSNMNSGNSNTGNNNSGMTGNRSSLKSADRNFIMQAAMGGMAEVEMGRLALSKSTSDAVKQFAQKMIDDHSANNQELMTIATARGVTLPRTLDAKHQRMMDKLTAMSGAEFDNAYIKEMGVKAHQEMEKLLQSNMKKVSDSELQSFIAKTLPVVQEHLRMAQGMSGGTSTTMNHR